MKKVSSGAIGYDACNSSPVAPKQMKPSGVEVTDCSSPVQDEAGQPVDRPFSVDKKSAARFIFSGLGLSNEQRKGDCHLLVSLLSTALHSVPRTRHIFHTW